MAVKPTAKEPVFDEEDYEEDTFEDDDFEDDFDDDDDDDDEDYDGECSYRVPLSRCYHHAALVVCQPLCAPVVHSSLGRIYCARPIVAEFYSIPLLGTVVLVFLRLSWLSNSS